MYHPSATSPLTSQQSTVPRNAFLSPDGSNLTSVKELARRIVDIALEHRAGVAERSAIPKHFELPVGSTLSEGPIDEEHILRDLQALLDTSTSAYAPNYTAHMGAVSTTISGLADFVASTINNNLIGLELSPSISLLEEALGKEYARLFGLPDTSGGMLATGGSLSNLHALTVARNAVLGTRTQSLRELPGSPVLFASEAAHASIRKAAMIMGLGAEGLVSVRMDDEGRMDTNDLEARISEAVARGQRPFCIVATAGTTVTGNIDPIGEIADLAQTYGLWLHVDAAWGGGLQLSKRLRDRLDSIDRADSITFCPQKMMLVALSSSLTLFRDWDRMVTSFREHFGYLAEDDGFIHRSEIGVQGSRPAEVLKLWLSVAHIGLRGYADMIEGFVGLADRVASEVATRPFLETVSKPESGIVCIRWNDEGLSREEEDDRTSALQARIIQEQGIYLSSLVFRGRRWIRAVFQNPFTGENVVDKIFVTLDAVRREEGPQQEDPQQEDPQQEDPQQEDPLEEDRDPRIDANVDGRLT